MVCEAYHTDSRTACGDAPFKLTITGADGMQREELTPLRDDLVTRDTQQKEWLAFALLCLLGQVLGIGVILVDLLGRV